MSLNVTSHITPDLLARCNLQMGCLLQHLVVARALHELARKNRSISTGVNDQLEGL